jgi:hypothetical protein
MRERSCARILIHAADASRLRTGRVPSTGRQGRLGLLIDRLPLLHWNPIEPDALLADGETFQEKSARHPHPRAPPWTHRLDPRTHTDTARRRRRVQPTGTTRPGPSSVGRRHHPCRQPAPPSLPRRSRRVHTRRCAHRGRRQDLHRLAHHHASTTIALTAPRYPSATAARRMSPDLNGHTAALRSALFQHHGACCP